MPLMYACRYAGVGPKINLQRCSFHLSSEIAGALAFTLGPLSGAHSSIQTTALHWPHTTLRLQVVWLCNKVRVRCNAQKLESMLQLLHDRDPQTPFIYASCLWQLCMCGMLTTAQMLMRDPYMPPLTDPGSPVCASLLCSALASQPQPEDMLSATLAFFRQQFADAGAEQLWFKHLASHNGAGKTPLLVCVELRNADMCR